MSKEPYDEPKTGKQQEEQSMDNVAQSFLQLRIAEIERSTGKISDEEFYQRTTVLMKNIQQETDEQTEEESYLQKTRECCHDYAEAEFDKWDPELRGAMFAKTSEEYTDAIAKIGDESIKHEQPIIARNYFKYLKDTGKVMIPEGNDEVKKYYDKIAQDVQDYVNIRLHKLFEVSGEKAHEQIEKQLEDKTDAEEQHPIPASQFTPLAQMPEEYYDNMDADLLTLFQAKTQNEYNEGLENMAKRVNAVYEKSAACAEHIVDQYFDRLEKIGRLKMKCGQIDMGKVYETIKKLIVLMIKKGHSPISQSPGPQQAISVRVDLAHWDEDLRDIISAGSTPGLSKGFLRLMDRTIAIYNQTPGNVVIAVEKLFEDIKKAGGMQSRESFEVPPMVRKTLICSVYQRVLEQYTDQEEVQPDAEFVPLKEFGDVDFATWDKDVREFANARSTAALKGALSNLSDRALELQKGTDLSTFDVVKEFLVSLNKKGLMNAPNKNRLICETLDYLRTTLIAHINQRDVEADSSSSMEEDELTTSKQPIDNKESIEEKEGAVDIPTADEVTLVEKVEKSPDVPIVREKATLDEGVRDAFVALEKYKFHVLNLAKRINVKYDKTAMSEEDAVDKYFAVLRKIGKIDYPQGLSEMDGRLKVLKTDVAGYLHDIVDSEPTVVEVDEDKNKKTKEEAVAEIPVRESSSVALNEVQNVDFTNWDEDVRELVNYSLTGQSPAQGLARLHKKLHGRIFAGYKVKDLDWQTRDKIITDFMDSLKQSGRLTAPKDNKLLNDALQVVKKFMIMLVS